MKDGGSKRIGGWWEFFGVAIFYIVMSVVVGALMFEQELIDLFTKNFDIFWGMFTFYTYVRYFRED